MVRIVEGTADALGGEPGVAEAGEGRLPGGKSVMACSMLKLNMSSSISPS